MTWSLLQGKEMVMTDGLRARTADTLKCLAPVESDRSQSLAASVAAAARILGFAHAQTACRLKSRGITPHRE